MCGVLRTRDRLLNQWADVATRAKERYCRSLIRQGYRWAVCLESHYSFTSRFGEPGGREVTKVLAFYRRGDLAYQGFFIHAEARGVRPKPTSDCAYFERSTEGSPGGYSNSEYGRVYLIDLCDEDDREIFFRILG